MAKSQKVRNSEHRIKIKAAGFCPDHSTTRVPAGRVRCAVCLAAEKIRTDALRLAGKCPRHPNLNAVIGKKSCANCLLSARLMNLPASIREDAKQALQEFDGRCEGCGTCSPGGAGKAWCLDHKGDKFRGILCFHCNWALGHVFDNALILCKLICYLGKK